MSQTTLISRFIADARLEDLPPPVVGAAKRGFLDCLGCGVRGAGSRAARIVERLVDDAGKSEATLLASGGRRASVHGAILVNATAAHALDFDDTLTAPAAAAALAIAEARNLSGRDLLVAYALGCEIASRAADGMGGWDNERGWHMMGVAGGFGAAVAAGYLLRLSAEQIGHALGIAATQAAGLVAMHGFLAKPFHSGRAAESGYYGAELARHGCTAGPALEGPRSVFRAMGGEESPPLAKDLGRAWALLRSRLKPFPCGRLGHAAIEAVLKARAGAEFRLEDVASVRVRVNPRAQYLMGEPEPKTGTESMFSIGHAAAAAIVHGRVDPEHFTDEAVKDAAIAKFRRQTLVVPDERLKPGQAVAEITTRSGAQLTAEVAVQKGLPENPLTDADVRAKFLGLAEPVIGPKRSVEAADLVAGLEEIKDAGEIARRCG
ncbi:MAG TPA: MmgE/PrpD family protein [Candidatus Acidoferrales bacterium]|nr:MmgE/PrpD family protein [Candidatus Acidoferrales bacterium]